MNPTVDRPTLYDPAAVACPVCGAEAADPCQGRRRARTSFHRERHFAARRSPAAATGDLGAIFDRRATGRRIRKVPITDGAVYFIGEGYDGPVKVGWTAEASHDAIERRRRQLQTGNSRQLVVIGWRLGTAEDERRLHERLGGHRIRGEWFEPAGAVLSEARR